MSLNQNLLWKTKLSTFEEEKIESIVSSCECVKPSLVRYSDSSTTTADGVLFEFIPDEASAESIPRPMHLGVEVTLTMASGKTRTVTVNYRHALTLLVDGSQ